MNDKSVPTIYVIGNKWQTDRYAFMSAYNQKAGITQFRSSPKGSQPYFHIITKEDRLHNFLNEQEILDEVNARYSSHKLGDIDRLLTNTVASQPCCFNLFAPLKHRQEMSSRFFSYTLLQIIKVEHIEIEFTPNSKTTLIDGFIPNGDESLGDQSKFGGTDADVAVFYTTRNNKRGVILIEFKYIEPGFSFCGSYRDKKAIRPICDHPDYYKTLISPYLKKPTKQPECGYLKYQNWALTKDSKLFNHKAIVKAGKCPFRFSEQQLWRNLLLAENVARVRNLDEFHFCVVSPAENTYLWERRGGIDVEKEFRKILTPFGNKVFRRLEFKRDFVDNLKKCADDEWQWQWIKKFQRRYIPCESIDSTSEETTIVNRADEIATRDSWKNRSFFLPKRLKISLHFTSEQVSKLKRGLIPQTRDDVWFIFFENDLLYFHRAHSGNCVYQAELQKENGAYCIKEFLAETHPSLWKVKNDNENIQIFNFLITCGLLAIDIKKSYIAQNLLTDFEQLNSWNTFGRMLYKDIYCEDV